MELTGGEEFNCLLIRIVIHNAKPFKEKPSEWKKIFITIAGSERLSPKNQAFLVKKQEY